MSWGERSCEQKQPCGFNPTIETCNVDGMTLRDWFAGMALSGIASLYVQAGGTSEDIAKVNAKVAYLMADAMLVAKEAHE